MYWTHFTTRGELQPGNVLVHGATRLNLSPRDVATYVDPSDAALVLGFKDGFPVWMTTLRRHTADDAIVEQLQPVFTELADESSVECVFRDVLDHARALGYERVWLVPALYREPRFLAALRRIVDASGRPLELQTTSGLVAFRL